jgi:glycerophosphoryl diester phosphodiesterase
MKIMGHRGARNEVSENTLKSIQTALDAGVESIEIDIHLSKDGKMIVIHDDSLDRTTDGKGLVLDHTLAEIKSLSAGEGELVPELFEVIRLIADKAILFIEIKADHCEEKLVGLLTQEKNLELFIVKSFNHRYLKKIKELNPKIKTAALIHALPIDPAHLVKACHGDILSISLGFLDKELVKLCHREKIEVCAWNCNDIKDLKRIIETGVDYLGTDIPTLLCKEFQKLK